MKLADLFIKLGLDSKEFNSGIDSAKQKTKLFADGIKKIGGMIAGAFAVSAIVGFAKEIFNLANESIKVENELGAAIRANGKDVKSTLDNYKQFANQMMEVSTVDDETTLSLLRLAETLQSKAPKEAVANALALSKALGVDLNTATKMAVMAQSDMYTMLGRYVPALRDAGTEAERTAEYSKLLASGVAMLSDEINTSQGKLIQNKNAWDNIKETWGMLIAESTVLKEALSSTNELLYVMGSESATTMNKIAMATTINDKNAHAIYLKVKARDEELQSLRDKSIQKQQLENDLKLQFGQSTINGIDNIIVETKKEVKANEELAKSIDKVTSARKANIEVGGLMTGADSGSKIGTIKDTGKFGTEPDSTTPGAGLPIVYENAVKAEEEKQKQLLENFASFKQEFGSMVQDFSIEVVDQLGMAFGEMLKTGDFPDDFGDNILAAIGGFISQLGKMLIGLGIASEAFQGLLKSAFTDPVSAGLAIAAGAGLVLLGGAIKGFAKGGMSGATSGSVSTPSYSGSNYGSSGTRAENNQYEFIIKGDTLVGVLNNTKRKQSNIG